MSYIDKETVLKTVADIISDCKVVHKHRALNRNIKQIPELVHCKDCKYLMFSDFYGECSKGYMGIVSPDDYCSRGERKDNV